MNAAANNLVLWLLWAASELGKDGVGTVAWSFGDGVGIKTMISV